MNYYYRLYAMAISFVGYVWPPCVAVWRLLTWCRYLCVLRHTYCTLLIREHISYLYRPSVQIGSLLVQYKYGLQRHWTCTTMVGELYNSSYEGLNNTNIVTVWKTTPLRGLQQKAHRIFLKNSTSLPLFENESHRYLNRITPLWWPQQYTQISMCWEYNAPAKV